MHIFSFFLKYYRLVSVALGAALIGIVLNVLESNSHSPQSTYETMLFSAIGILSMCGLLAFYMANYFLTDRDDVILAAFKALKETHQKNAATERTFEVVESIAKYATGLCGACVLVCVCCYYVFGQSQNLGALIVTCFFETFVIWLTLKKANVLTYYYELSSVI